MTTATEIELRCPHGARQLLMKIRSEGGRPKVVPGNLLELACRDCARTERKFDSSVRRVLHQFNFAGELVRTVRER